MRRSRAATKSIAPQPRSTLHCAPKVRQRRIRHFPWNGERQMGKQKRYSLEFRERAVRRMKLGDNISRLARELGIDRSCLYIWKRKMEQRPYRRKGGSEKDWRDHRIEELEAKITRLEGVIGSQWLELDFF